MISAEYPKAVWTPGPNFDSGRQGHSILSLCIHGTASPNQDIDWWAAQAARRGGVHYMVGKQPYTINHVSTQVIQFVKEGNTAWGNGVVDPGCMPIYAAPNPNPNLTTISIEHVKFTADNSEALTDSQAQESFALILYLCKKYNIPAHWVDGNGRGITAHMLIDPIRRDFCPGPYPWSRLFSYLHANGVKGSY